MKPDYRLIHALEYELGFRDDPPPSRAPSAANVSDILKEAWTATDEPGAVIYYDPKQGRPTY